MSCFEKFEKPSVPRFGLQRADRFRESTLEMFISFL